MRIHGLNNLTKPFPADVVGSLHGFKLDSVELNKRDVDKLLAMSPAMLHDFFERLSTKFREV